MFYDMINPTLLARIRAQTGAPTLLGARDDHHGLRAQPGLARELVQSGCQQLLGQIRAAGYKANDVQSGEGAPWAFEMLWTIPSPDGEDALVRGSIGQTDAGWSFHLDVEQPNEDTEILTLESAQLDDATFLRWLAVWLDTGLSRHAFLASIPAPAAGDDAQPEQSADQADTA